MDPSATTSRAADLRLGRAVVAEMRAQLPLVAERTVAVVTAEVPGYGGSDGVERAVLERGVEMALSGFLSLASSREDSDPSAPMASTLEAAYALGRGEARSGRSMDALLAAYRVGARVAWRELATAAVGRGLPAETVVPFAELVFAYIDELSGASLVGYADQLATTRRVQQRYRERLGRNLLEGASEESLLVAAKRAEWTPPEYLIAVILPEAKVRAVLSSLDPRTLQPVEDLPGLTDADAAVLLVPAAGNAGRVTLLRLLRGIPAVVGGTRPWLDAGASYRRALRARDLSLGSGADSPVDTDEHLPEIVIGADAEALADLRARALAPMDSLRPEAAARLVATLRSWLLHGGRRDDVAADLVVHPQTVRYRMGQVRELYGDRLNDPRTVLELLIALGIEGRSVTSDDDR